MSYFKEYLENVNENKIYKIIKKEYNSGTFERKMKNFLLFPSGNHAQDIFYGLYVILVENYNCENSIETVEAMKKALLEIYFYQNDESYEIEYENDRDYEAWENMAEKFLEKFSKGIK